MAGRASEGEVTQAVQALTLLAAELAFAALIINFIVQTWQAASGAPQICRQCRWQRPVHWLWHWALATRSLWVSRGQKLGSPDGEASVSLLERDHCSLSACLFTCSPGLQSALPTPSTRVKHRTC